MPYNFVTNSISRKETL